GARDSEAAFFRIAPSLGEREYLQTVFRELTRLPAAAPLFDREHNLVWRLGPSAEGCKQLLQLFRAPHPDAPAFRFGQPDTRFLGDLYQDLDDGVRERFALLQTPDFVESFILDRTLEPAIREYGIDHTDLIDPTCGSGHFLLGAFNRIYDHLRRAHPGWNDRKLAAETLERIHGVDINPYAVSIARFRLTLQFLESGGYDRLLSNTPAPVLRVIVADSLYYGFAGGQGDLAERPDQTPEQTAAWLGSNFSLEDPEAARQILVKKTYAAVVGNPPYITVKDPVLREFYRQHYTAAAGKYALSAPFMQRFFQLAKGGGGFVGQITSNSFTKREFGVPLVEKVLPSLDLELIVNAAGACIPGHGTPTVLVFGRNRPPSSDHVDAVLAKHGEPRVPSDPAQGQVWRSIVEHWNEAGFENDFVSVAALERSQLGVHPWSLAGGGASSLKLMIEQSNSTRLEHITAAIGFDAIMGEDDIYIGPPGWAKRLALDPKHIRSLCTGEDIRDWRLSTPLSVVFPYDRGLTASPPTGSTLVDAHFWQFRTNLANRQQFGKDTLEAGLEWYEYRSFYK
ncbi:BREX-2 system adenine-specific DNA-methyltransferase PglX, partial [Nannocystis pusilla]|uniref:BREX-2 system adenine-specific DNA-methyltransferase PglX n=1 Tax=Nannocystis pusilla TaxID=889268 RepID=UPI003BEF5645